MVRSSFPRRRDILWQRSVRVLGADGPDHDTRIAKDDKNKCKTELSFFNVCQPISPRRRDALHRYRRLFCRQGSQRCDHAQRRDLRRDGTGTVPAGYRPTRAACLLRNAPFRADPMTARRLARRPLSSDLARYIPFRRESRKAARPIFARRDNHCACRGYALRRPCLSPDRAHSL